MNSSGKVNAEAAPTRASTCGDAVCSRLGAAVGERDARLAWTTWSTAARIRQLQGAGRSWPEIEARPGRAKVGEDPALWGQIMEQNPEYLAAAQEILAEDEHA